MTITRNAKSGPAVVADPTNTGSGAIDLSLPYAVEFTVQGTSKMLFHRWQSEAVEARARAAKGSAAKKTDDPEVSVYRDGDGNVCLPGVYVWNAVVSAAKYRQDPRNARKSGFELFRAGVVPLTELAPIMVSPGHGEDESEQVDVLGRAAVPAKTWDFLDARRVTVQRSGITRVRPAFLDGWTATMVFQVLLPEYIGPADLHDTLVNAGRFVGVADMRPTYGRFAVVSFTETGI